MSRPMHSGAIRSHGTSHSICSNAHTDIPSSRLSLGIMGTHPIRWILAGSGSMLRKRQNTMDLGLRATTASIRLNQVLPLHIFLDNISCVLTASWLSGAGFTVNRTCHTPISSKYTASDLFSQVARRKRASKSIFCAAGCSTASVRS